MSNLFQFIWDRENLQNCQHHGFLALQASMSYVPHPNSSGCDGSSGET